MTNLEHIIENTLIHFENDEDAEEILSCIKTDINFKEQPLAVNQIYEICQYVWCDYLDYGNRLEKDDLEDAWNEGVDD